jgi:hypothetical protein
VLIAGSGDFDDSQRRHPVDKVDKRLGGKEKADSGRPRFCIVNYTDLYQLEAAEAAQAGFRERTEPIKPLERFVNRAKYGSRPKIDR